MSAIVDKQVHIADFRARRLERLAAEGCTTEDALIEKGLDMLFREQDRQAAREESLLESKEALMELQDEIPPQSGSSLGKVQLDGAVFVVGTPVAQHKIIRLEHHR